MKLKWAVLALWGAAAPLGVWADERVTITAVQPPVVHSLNGRAVDVNGFVPGMSESDARKLLGKKYGRVPLKDNRVSLTMNYKGARLESQEFTTSMGFGGVKGDTKGLAESVSLYFAGPALGNPVRGVYRRLYYDDVFAAPSMADVVAGLVAKYGEPSTDSGNTPRWGREMFWHFTESGMIPCQGKAAVTGLPHCAVQPALRDDIDTRHYFSTARKEGVVLVLRAYLRPHAGSDKLMDLEVLVDDIQNRALGQQLGDAQLTNFVDARLNGGGARPAGGGKAPAL